MALSLAALGCTNAGSSSDLARNSPSVPAVDQPAPTVIEESDIVKLDGTELYLQSEKNGFSVISVEAPETPKLLQHLPALRGKAGELYVHGSAAMIVFDQATPSCKPELETLGSLRVPTSSEVVSVATPTTAASVADRFCLPGKVVASRLIADILYVVSTASMFGESATWVSSLDVTNPAQLELIDSIVVDSETKEVLVSTSAIWLAQAVGSTFNGSSNETPTGTLLRYVDIAPADGSLHERGSIDVEGAPAGRFHMDEWNSMFRIVTFSQRWAGSNLYVIDATEPDALTLRGSISGIAPNEDLHATRFVEDKAYIVTYEPVIYQTDPLWVVSLANPDSPLILAHLEIPGWSDYVFPRGNRLLAVGRGDRGLSVAASLFDIEDPQRPRELRRLEFGSGNATSEANTDFRGVSVLENADPTGVPLAIVPFSQGRFVNGTCKQTHYFKLIEIAENDLLLRGESQHDRAIRRTMPIQDKLYAVGDGYVSALDIANHQAPIETGNVVIGSTPTTDPAACNITTPVPNTRFRDDFGDDVGTPYHCAIRPGRTGASHQGLFWMLGLAASLAWTWRRRRG